MGVVCDCRLAFPKLDVPLAPRKSAATALRMESHRRNPSASQERELTSDLRTTEGQLDVWLLQGSERFVSDPEVSEVLIKAAREKDTRRCLLLLSAILDTPGLADRLLEALRPELAAMAGRNSNGRRRTASPTHASAPEGRRIR